MKKIKYLLLWIVWLFLIGVSSSTYFNKVFYVDYNVLNTQNNSSFYLNSNDSRVLYHFNDSNSYWYINPYFARQWNSINRDISNYSLQNNVVGPNYLSYFVPGFNSNWNSAVIIAQWTNSSRWSAIFPLTSSITSYDSSYLDFSVSSVYFRIFWDSSCLNTDIITNSDKVFCTPSYIFYYDWQPYTRSSLWNIYDSQYDWVDYVKGPVQSSLGMWYSFAFVSWNWRNNWTLDSDSHLIFKSVFFSGSDIQSYWGNLLFFKLNNNAYITWDNSDLLYMALQITWDVSDYSLIYSIYYCNWISLNSCVFSSWGFINWYQNLSWFNGWLLEFLSSPWTAKIWNSFDIDTNSFSIYWHYFDSAILKTRTYWLELLPTAWINIIDSLINNGGWNWYTSTWSITFSGCIDTEVCTYITWDNWIINKICHSECVSQEVISSWGYISYNWTYYFVDTPLSLDNLKSSSLEYSTWYLDSWGILNPVYFEDLFDPSKRAVWVCPFPYYSGPLDFLSNIWTDWVYLFMPLICFYSAFQHWSHLSYFDNSEVITWGVLISPLLNWNSENHRILFMFLDILLSIGLLWLFHHLSSLL